MLIVFAGRPGTGKSTLARMLAERLGAALLRVDAIEAAVVASGLAEHPVGVVGYVVAQNLTTECLIVGTPVVVDAVNPVPQSRAPWSQLAAAAGVPLRVVEVALTDEAERRRRIEQRRPDHHGQAQPTWEQLADAAYVPWDVGRDGPRLPVDGSDPEAALAEILRYVTD